MFVVLPEHPWWEEGGPQVKGMALPDGFAYTSDRNDWWLTADELSNLLRFAPTLAA